MSIKVNYFILSILFFCLGFVQAQQYDKVKIRATEVTENIYMLEGAGGNIALFTGPEGSVMVDDQFLELAPKIKKVIDSLTTFPVKYLINTHWHGDHTGGNSAFAKDGATIVSNENVRQRLMNEQVRPFGRSTPAAPSIAWPKLTFNEKMSIHINGEDIHLIHVHNAHTDGDAFVYFPSYNVLHMGDCFFKDRFPFIDLQMGGHPDGLIAAVEAALMLADEDTKIIPGHGTLANKEELRAYLQMLKIIKGRILTSIKSGIPIESANVEEIVSGFKQWGEGFINPEKMVKTLYTAYETSEDE